MNFKLPLLIFLVILYISTIEGSPKRRSSGRSRSRGSSTYRRRHYSSSNSYGGGGGGNHDFNYLIIVIVVTVCIFGFYILYVICIKYDDDNESETIHERHLKDMNYICNLCQKSFTRSNYLTIHFRTVHESWKYEPEIVNSVQKLKSSKEPELVNLVFQNQSDEHESVIPNHKVQLSDQTESMSPVHKLQSSNQPELVKPVQTPLPSLSKTMTDV